MAVPGGIERERKPDAGSFEPHFREYSLMIEYKHLPKYAPTGLYVVPSFDDLGEWHGVLFIRQGVYKGGVFKFVLSVPETYPNERPSVRFTTSVYHPQVSPEGEVNLERAFPTWTARKDYIWHVLARVKRIFYHIDCEAALNPAAAALYESDQTAFGLLAEECADASATFNSLYDNQEGSSLVFSEYQASFAAIAEKIQSMDEANPTDEDRYAWVAELGSSS